MCDRIRLRHGMPTLSQSDGRRDVRGSGDQSQRVVLTGWRCVICGEILDPIILQNRTLHPELQYGRARPNEGGMMVSKWDWEPPHPEFER